MNGSTSILRILLMNNLCFNSTTKQILTHENHLVISMKESNLWKWSESCQACVKAKCLYLDKSINNKWIGSSVGINIYAP